MPIPPTHNLEIHGFLKPAMWVGGDYYDFIHDHNSIYIAIGDVSGKGEKANSIVVMVRDILRALIKNVSSDILTIMELLNRSADIPRNMFMSLNLLQWEIDTNVINYVSAGHEHILLYRDAFEKVEHIKAGGVVLSLAEKFNKQQLHLKHNDHILLYTDGVTEARNMHQQQFGLQRTSDLLKLYCNKSPKVLCEQIYKELLLFSGETKQYDDITLVALRYSNINYS